jgi:NAD-dependent deacetylase
MSFHALLARSKALQALGEEITKAQRIVVLTGAGVSKESGIPTFRDAQTGLWAKYDPHRLASREGFLADPACVWGWYDFRRNKVWCVQPNPGHQAIRQLETICQQAEPKRVFTLITQNVDNLHQQAGSEQVLQLHGNIFETKCLDCERPFELSKKALQDTLQDQSAEGEGVFDADEDDLPLPPTCDVCGGWIRPNVVWFGEMLNDGILSSAYQASREADVMIVAGTSGVVYPAADLPAQAKRSGAVLIEVNPEPSALSPLMDVSLKGTSAELLPDLVHWMGSLMSGENAF